MTAAENLSVNMAGGPPSRPADSENFPPVFSDAVFLMINNLETGGTERQFAEMAKGLSARGVPVHLGCVRNQGAFGEGLGGLAAFPLFGSLYGLPSMRSRWRLLRHLKKLEVGVAHSFDFYTNLMLVPAAKLAGIPVIGSQRQLGDLMTPAQFQAQLAVFRLCDRVVCNSRAAAKCLIGAGLEERAIATIGNALPDTAFAEVKPALDPTTGMVRVGMIARMNKEYKNHRGFLRAARLVTGKFPRAEFVLAGDGPLRSELEKEAAAFGLEKNTRFLGDRRDVSAVLASLDVSVVASESEGLSNVMLESMAAGVPVVATAVGGNVELAGEDRALLVAAKDDRALAEGILRLLDDRSLGAAIARAARPFVQDNFRLESVCRQYEDLYAEVLRDKRAGRARGRARLRAYSTMHPPSKVRVALVGPSLRYVGGQAVQADLLLRHWRDDPEVEARFVAVDPPFPFGLRWAERVPFLRTVVRAPLYWWMLWRRLKDVDVAHIFSASYFSFLVAPLPAHLTARLRGKRTLINYRSGEARDHLEHSSIARNALQSADGLVVPSGYLEAVFRDFGLPTRVVPNFVDLAQFHYRQRRPFRPHLVCTRGFHPYYSVDVVIRAFARVQELFPDAQLDLVGNGPQEGELRELVQELQLSGVSFKGVASRQEIARFYDHADIFINASWLDNMPVSVLEAFASGTPVITTAAEGIRYMVEHERTGLLSPTGDPDALAANVVRVLRESTLATQLASNARDECRRYAWSRVREQWLEVYRSLGLPLRPAVQEAGEGARAGR